MRLSRPCSLALAVTLSFVVSHAFAGGAAPSKPSCAKGKVATMQDGRWRCATPDLAAPTKQAALLLPAVQKIREAPRRSSTANASGDNGDADLYVSGSAPAASGDNGDADLYLTDGVTPTAGADGAATGLKAPQPKTVVEPDEDFIVAPSDTSATPAKP